MVRAPRVAVLIDPGSGYARGVLAGAGLRRRLPGQHHLRQRRRLQLQLGWYKVTVLTGLPGDPDIKVKPVFLDPNKSPLSVEVVASAEPGRYEFKMTSR